VFIVCLILSQSPRHLLNWHIFIWQYQ